jgi:ABC-type uncharacterized transport system auxiliary subunit
MGRIAASALRRAVWPWLAGVVLLAAACGSVPRRYYYALSYPEEPAGAAQRAALHPFRLRVKPFGVALPYNRPQIVYRQSPFEFNYYAFRMWSAKPQHMLRELTERQLEAARLVENVSQEYGDKPPDYELGAEVLAIEEYDSGDVWYGHLSMRFELFRFRDHTRVWTYRFDRKRKVYEKDPVYVVRAISRLLEEELNRVTAALDEVLSKERGVAPTLTAPGVSPDDAAVPVGPAPTPPDPGRIAPEPRRPDERGPDPDDLIVPDEPGPRRRTRGPAPAPAGDGGDR